MTFGDSDAFAAAMSFGVERLTPAIVVAAMVSKLNSSSLSCFLYLLFFDKVC